MESTKETWCQAGPEGPIFCINNCGFWESAATMNMQRCYAIKAQQAAPMELNVVPVQARADGSSSSQVARLSRMWDQADASLVPRGLVKPASTVSVANFSALLTATLSKTALLLITKANPVIKAEKLDKI
ncbi:hypothetical protein Tco_0894022 [Tanacetum coccineum]|uniref:Uncharacterized protein n=1 Tax=Tanacetum coccineum TaxID=301880 RepID=A0ABQ5CAI0_9ASTR